MEKLTELLGRFAFFLVLLAALSSAMNAEVGLMLNEALEFGASKWTGAGHSAVYLSGVCIKSPIELRLCDPGESGIVLSNYQAFGEDHSYEWNAIPLNVFLYGVEDESARPIYADSTVRWLLQERYREKYLHTICTGSCATHPNAQWRQMVASLFLRDIYMFSLKSTREQDQSFVEKFNREANVGHYSGLRYNCADFALDVVNTYYPNSAKPDHINDFWMTSPKAIARSFAHYGAAHPELEFHVTRFSQIPGEFALSHDNRKGTEQLYRANKWRLPLAVLRPQELVVFTSAYMFTGRFNPELELQRRPSGDIIGLQKQLGDAREVGDAEQQKQLKQKVRHSRANSLGTSEEWASYDAILRQYEAEAVEMGYVRNEASLRSLTHHTVKDSWITMDDNGGLWLTARNGQSHPPVGLSANTLTADRSDSRLGYLMTLSRVDAELRKKKKNRETLVYFRKDWQLMEHLRSRAVPRMPSYLAGAGRTHSGGGAAQ